MLRHPIYLLICLFAICYLAVAGVRGWSAWHMATRGFNTMSGGRGSAGSFNHK